MITNLRSLSDFRDFNLYNHDKMWQYSYKLHEMEPPRYVVHSGGTVGIQFIYI
jgi:hypothetical protein